MASIPCPSCETVHEIDQPLSSLEGKKVRCAHCREIFTVRASEQTTPENFDDIPAWEEEDLLAASVGQASESDVVSAAMLQEDVKATKPASVATKASNIEYELEFKWDSPPPSAQEEEVPAKPVSALPAEAPAAQQEAASIEIEAPQPRIRKPAAKKPTPAPKRQGGFSFPFLNKAPEGATAQKPPMRAMVMAAGIASLAAFGIARHEIVRFAPQVAPIFDAIGLSVNIHGLEFSEIKSRIAMEGDAEILEITGTITNVTNEVRRVPVLRLSIQNVNSQDIFVWTANAEKQEMAPKEVHRFRRRLASPPAESHHVMVRFVAKDDIVASIR
jgi:predicted Zn finger-like uncharacterized protein